MLYYDIKFVALIAILNMSVSGATSGADLMLAQAETTPSTSPTEKKSKLVSLWQPGDVGERMNIRGRVTSIDGTPVVGAVIFIRQTDGNGDYHPDRYNAQLVSGAKGSYQFGSVLPGQYMGVKHVHLWVKHDSYEFLDTRILFKGDPNLDESTAPQAIFLEEGNIKGETVLYGRFDIVLTPR